MLALHLPLDDPHQVFAVLVGVLRRIPIGREAVDERLRHVELRLADALGDRELELLGVDELVGEPHHRQHDRVLDHFHRREVLRVAQDELRDADASRLADRFAQQRVGALAALRRHQEVRALEEAIVDVFRLDEGADVDRPALLERRGLEILLRQHDEAAALVLVAFDELVPGDRLVLALADPLEAHR